MYYVNYPIESEEAITTREKLEGLRNEKFLTLKGAYKRYNAIHSAVIINKDGHLIAAGNNHKFKFKASTKRPEKEIAKNYYASESFKKCYNSLKILQHFLNNNVKEVSKDNEVFIGRDEYGMCLVFALDDFTDLEDIAQTFSVPLSSTIWEEEKMSKLVVDKFTENYYDEAYKKKWSIDDVIKAKTLWDEAIKDKILKI